MFPSDRVAMDPISFHQDVDLVSQDTMREMLRGLQRFGTYKSLHEAHSVIREEFDELWEEIRRREPDLGAVAKEALHLAATAMRLVLEVRHGLGKRTTEM